MPPSAAWMQFLQQLQSQMPQSAITGVPQPPTPPMPPMGPMGPMGGPQMPPQMPPGLMAQGPMGGSTAGGLGASPASAPPMMQGPNVGGTGPGAGADPFAALAQLLQGMDSGAGGGGSPDQGPPNPSASPDQGPPGPSPSSGGGNAVVNTYGTSTPQSNPLIQAYLGQSPQQGGQQYGPGYLTAVADLLHELHKGVTQYAALSGAQLAQPTGQDYNAAYKNLYGLLDYGWQNFPQFQGGTNPAGVQGLMPGQINPGGLNIPYPGPLPMNPNGMGGMPPLPPMGGGMPNYGPGGAGAMRSILGG